jgi:Ca-activated chloride channel family protein
MSFDAPSGLWLLLTLPAIVALWLLRPRRPRVRIPSVLLWPTSSAERRSARPWQRLRNHPLLWLQLLIGSLLALAAAQPFIPSQAADKRLIVLLDASGSMRATDVAPSRWDAARSAVKDLATTLGPDQSLSIIRLDDQPRILLADTRDATQVQSTLANESPAYGPIDAATAVALAAGLARGGPSEWVLVGDGQIPELPGGTSVPPETHFRFIPIGSQTASNVAITAVSLRASGNTFAVQVGIRNHGDAPATGTVQLTSDSGSVLASSQWTVQPDQDTYVGFNAIPSGPAWFQARLSDVSPSSANALATDDRAWAVAPNDAFADAQQQRALLVSSGNTFLERALAVEGSLRTFKIAPADLPQLVSQGDATRYPLVILDRQSADTALPAGAGVLRIAGLSGDTFQPRLIAPAPEQSLLRNVDWSDVRIGRATRLDPDSLAGWQTIVSSDGGPLLLTRTVRDGDRTQRQALLTFELGESDLPLRSAFPVLVANLLDWLAPRPEGSPRSVTAGADLQLQTSPLAQDLRIEPVLDTSDATTGATEQLAPPWPARAFRPSAPGVYRAVEDDPDGQVSTTYVVAEAFSATESDLHVQEPHALSSQTAESDSLANIVRGVRSGIWPWLLGALLVLASAEWLVDARGR